MVGLHQYPVKPSGADINENFLSEEAMQEFGIKEQLVSFVFKLIAVLHKYVIETLSLLRYEQPPHSHL